MSAKTGCLSCHEDYGRKDTYRYDAWGTASRVANLTEREFRGGTQPEDLFRRLRVGIVTVGMPDETWGERVVSCVVPETDGTTTAEQVIDFCRRHMSREKVPSAVFLVDALPRGASGKVALPEVKRLVAELSQKALVPSDGSAITGRDSITTRVFDLAAQSFNTPLSELSVDSEPESTAGWSSLAHMDFLLALESAFGIKLAPGDMLEIVTLGDAIEYAHDRLFGPGVRKL